MQSAMHRRVCAFALARFVILDSSGASERIIAFNETDEKLSAFLELQRAIHRFTVSLTS